MSCPQREGGRRGGSTSSRLLLGLFQLLLCASAPFPSCLPQLPSVWLLVVVQPSRGVAVAKDRALGSLKQMDFLAVLEVRSPKPRCSWDCTPSGVWGPWGGFSCTSQLWWLPAGPCQSSANGCVTPSLPLSSRGLLLCVSVSKPPLLLRTPVIGSGPKLIQHDLIVTNYICKDPISELGHMHKFHVDQNFGDMIQASSGGRGGVGSAGSQIRNFFFLFFLESFRKSLRKVSFFALGA